MRDRPRQRRRFRPRLLVPLSPSEREREGAADVGVDVGAMGEAWNKSIAELEAAFRAGGSAQQIATRLEALGVALAAGLPITADDVNELSDEVAS